MSPPRGFLAPPLFPDDQAGDRAACGVPSPTSLDAWERVRPHLRASHERILAIFRLRSPVGTTVHEVARHLGKLPSDISGRLTELCGLGRLKVRLNGAGKPVKRGGARVLVLAEHFARGDEMSELMG